MSEGIFFYILDTETTGLKVGHAEICEYSIIRCSDRLQLTRQIKADNPANASYDALRITGKTISDLYKGISKQQAIEDFHEFINRDGLTPSHRCIIAHNCSFDQRFLHHLWKQYDQEFPADLWLDTVQLSKRLASQMGQPKAKVKLESVMDLFGLKKLAGAHSAKGDSRNTYTLWNHLLKSNIEYLDLIKTIPMRKIDDSYDDLMDEFSDI